MEEDGEAVPEPLSLDEVMADPDNRDGGVAVLIPAPARVLEHIDRHAESHGFTRSGFLTAAAKRAIREVA